MARSEGATIAGMNFGKFAVPVIGIVLLGFAFRAYGWGGVALVAGGLVMVVLLQFSRAMSVLRRAADRPVGSVGSAVMLNSKLRRRVTLMHVVALTRAIGELRTPKDTQPEVFRWTDAGGSYVDAIFVNGRLTEWSMFRPEEGAGEQPALEEAEAGAAGEVARPPA